MNFEKYALWELKTSFGFKARSAVRVLFITRAVLTNFAFALPRFAGCSGAQELR